MNRGVALVEYRATRRASLCRAIGLAALSFLSATMAAAKPKTTDGPIPGIEYAYQQLDPQLYDIAKRYFPSNAHGIAPKRLFRLTREQIDVTVAMLLPSYVTQPIRTSMQRDPLQTNYEYAELLSINPANFSALSKWIGEIAGRVRSSPKALIDCRAEDDACLRASARSFVVKAFRGDVSEDKVGQIVGFFAGSAKTAGVGSAAGDLVEVVLNSPRFLFRQELDVNDRNRLAPPQLLQAVTYTVADSPPEKLGLSSSTASEYLKSGTAAGPTIDRIVRSTDAREKLARFFKAWLELKEPDEFTISKETFPAFERKLATAMLAETDQFLKAQLARTQPSLKDITQAAEAHISKELEGLYGSKAADASGAKPVATDPKQRLGIFSQPAVIASHSGPVNTRPMKRGVFWVRKAMCMDMSPPPKDIHIDEYKMAGKTERQRMESVTKAPACLGCHQLIDPFAFFQESYDALGRWRTSENGEPIDTRFSIDFLD